MEGSGSSHGKRMYRGSVRVLSLVFVAVGLLILVSTLARGGGPLSVGIFMGLAFVAVGALRFWLASRTGS